MSRKTTMGFSRWRIQVLRADGFVSEEQWFLNEGDAFAAFDRMDPKLPKRLQVRHGGRARYVTIESEGGA